MESVSDSQEYISVVPRNDFPKYTVDNFISLGKVAKDLAAKFDDEPDLIITLERCLDCRVSAAIWISSSIDVWQYSYETKMLLEESPLLSLSTKGDYIVPWHGALFLNHGSIINLLESKEQTVFAGEFSPCAGYSIPQVDSLSVASSRAIASAEFIVLHPEDEEALSNDDGYKAFTIKDVRVLRCELGKLGLAEVGTDEPAPELDLMQQIEPIKANHTTWILQEIEIDHGMKLTGAREIDDPEQLAVYQEIVWNDKGYKAKLLKRFKCWYISGRVAKGPAHGVTPFNEAWGLIGLKRNESP